MTQRQCEVLMAKAAEWIPIVTGMRLQVVSPSLLDTYNPTGFGRFGGRARLVPVDATRSIVRVSFDRCYVTGAACDKDLFDATGRVRGILAGEAKLFAMASGMAPSPAPERGTIVPPHPTTASPRPALSGPLGNPKPPAEIGQFSYEAERIPAAKACAAMPQATLVNKGPGFELYSVACRNADTLMVRCELGNCRALR